MPTVDNIDIQITASLKKTNSQLDALIKKLRKVSGVLSGIGVSTGKANKSISLFASSTKKSASSINSLAAVWGRFYANFFPVIRGIKQLNKSIKETTDYIEAFNYFQVSFNKIANEWKGDFAKYGYSNADAYAESFTKRTEETLSKLSGLQMNIGADGKGLLQETGTKNLGLSIREITQYASQLASVTNSVGQTGEVSLAASTAFSKLAGDISSLFNVDYSSVATNLQSGLIGQSRALYKYGIDITNATLQTYAFKLGLEKEVSEMTQAEKMQLRMLAILEQSKVSWGDLANTINSPSNMLRQFTTNLKEAGMMLGQLFIPLLEKALPFFNGLSIAIKRLLGDIAGFFGIKLDMSSFGQLSDTTQDLTGDVDELEEATKSAKKGLRAFDELKTINTGSQSSDSSMQSTIDLTQEIIKATQEYEKVWQKAYDNMEQRAQQFADRIENVLRPLKNLFKDISIGDWFAVGEDVSNIVSGIFDFFTRAIESVDWYKLGTNMGDFLAGLDWSQILKSVGKFIWEGINASLKFWEGMFEKAPFSTIFISVSTIPKMLKGIATTKTVSGITKLANAFKLATLALTGNKKSLKELNKLYPNFSKSVNVARKAFANFRFGIENGNFLTGLSEGFKAVKNNLTGMQKGLIGVGTGLIEFTVVKDSIEDIVNGTGSLATNIAELVVAVTGAGAAFSIVFGFPAGLIATGIVGLVGAIAGIGTAFNKIETQKFGESVKEALTNPGGIPISEVAQSVANSIISIGESFSSINEKSQELESTEKNVENVWLEIETIKTKMDAGVISVEEGTKELTRLFGELAQVAEENFGKIEEVLVAGFGENGAFGKYANAVGVNVTDSLLTAMGVTADMRDRTSELIALMSDPNISTEKYLEYQQELQAILGTTDEITSAMTDFQSSISNINLEEIFNKDGTINAKEFSSALDSVVSSVKETDKQLDEAGKNMLAYLEDLKENAKTAKEKAEIQTLIDLVPDAIEESKQLTRQQATLFTAEIQNELLGGIEQVIDDRAKEWDKKGPLEKLWLRLSQSINDKNDYVKVGIDNFKKNYADKLSDEIEKQMTTIGVEGSGYASDAMQEIINAMFDVEYYSDGNGEFAIARLNEDWREVVKGATQGIDALCQEEGKNAVLGYNRGIANNSDSTEKETETWLQKVIKKVKSVLDSHSPSRVLEGIGKDTVVGFNNGISRNENSSKTVASGWMGNFLAQLKESWGKIKEWWTKNVKLKVQNISLKVDYETPKGKLQTSIVNALGLGGWPSIGFYEVGGFPNKASLFWANENGIPELVGTMGGKTAVASGMEITGIKDAILQSSNRDAQLMERNNQLLSALLEKEYGITDSDIGKSAQRYARDYFNRTGNDAYSF